MFTDVDDDDASDMFLKLGQVYAPYYCKCKHSFEIKA